MTELAKAYFRWYRGSTDDVWARDRVEEIFAKTWLKLGQLHSNSSTQRLPKTAFTISLLVNQRFLFLIMAKR